MTKRLRISADIARLPDEAEVDPRYRLDAREHQGRCKTVVLSSASEFGRLVARRGAGIEIKDLDARRKTRPQREWAPRGPRESSSIG